MDKNDNNLLSLPDPNIPKEEKFMYKLGQKIKAFMRLLLNILNSFFVFVTAPFINPLFRICYLVGGSFTVKTMRLVRRARDFLSFDFVFVFIAMIIKFILKIFSFFKRAVLSVKNDFCNFGRKTKNGCIRVVDEIKTAVKDDKDKRFIPFVFVVAVFHAIRDNKRIIRRFNAYLFPVIALVGFMIVLAHGLSLQVGVEVIIEGETIGYVSSEADYYAATSNISSRIVYTSEDESYENNAVLELGFVSEDDINTVNELTDNIIQASAIDFVYASGVYVDGELYGVTADSSEITSYLNIYIGEYEIANPDSVVNFVRDIEIVEGFFSESKIQSLDEVIAALSVDAVTSIQYVATVGDTIWSIAAANGLTTDELYELNPGIDEEIVAVGQVFNIRNSQALLAVSVTTTVTYNETIAYSTVYTDDNSLYLGNSQTTVSGKDGESEIVAEITYQDGIEVSRKIISTTVVTAAVTEEISVGTKISTSSGDIYVGSVTGTGDYVWPLGGGGGYISELIWGYYGHTGMDIAGISYGTAIYAVDDGVVTAAGWSGGYGYRIIIDHGNGIQTLYAHCSSLYVSVGTTVSQGQTIAAAGSTGNSTGVHLHIEFIVNGYYEDPLDYLR